MTETVIIRKQQFRIRTSNQDLALQLRRELNDHLQVGLLTVYEEVFATMPALLQDTVYIDKLSLDLGKCTAENFSTMLPALLKQAMLKKLKQDSTDEIEIKMAASATGNNNRTSGTTGEATDAASGLFHFFEKGYYPWWLGGIDEKRKPAEMITSLDERAMENMIVKIISSPRQYGNEKGEKVQQRFLQHLSANDHARIIDMCIALQSDQQLKNNLHLLKADETVKYCCSFFSITEVEYRKELIRFMLQQSLEQIKDVLQSFVAQLSEKKKAAATTIETLKKGIEKAADHISPIKIAINAVVNTIGSEKTNGAAGKETKAKAPLTGSGKSENNTGIGKKPQPINQNPKHNPADDLPEEGVYIENGGLVILHPFLQPLLTELELIKADGQFADDAAKTRATVILNYLFTGNAEYAEYEMLLNKLLFGIAAEEVLPDDIVLTAKETHECDELLDTVLQYWEALKGAGTEAVRETFFRRKAKIRFKDNHWLLQVERNATDILLDRLPWGIGIIRLPWLQYLIHVEW